jgi:putative colanic acid biosynthesis acetyltransferase WcaB
MLCWVLLVYRKEAGGETRMSFLRDDWPVNHEWKARFILLFFRAAHRFASHRNGNKLIWLLGIPVMVFYRLIVEWLLNVEIPAKTHIGPGFKLRHGQGLVIHPGTLIGANVSLRHNTTIGNKNDQSGQSSRAPIIEDNADIGCHVVIIGPVTIGENAVIGAGSVVVKDIPANSVAVGNPAKVIAQKLLNNSNL